MKRLENICRKSFCDTFNNLKKIPLKDEFGFVLRLIALINKYLFLKNNDVFVIVPRYVKLVQDMKKISSFNGNS